MKPRSLLLSSLVLALTACGEKASAPSAASASASAVLSAPAVGSGPATVPPIATVAPVFTSPRRVSLWIRGGQVADGTGHPLETADVVVDGDKIVFVGKVADGLKAERTIDAKGLVVAPGFIDAHAHTDPTGNVDHLLAMGVTTIVTGQDGSSSGDVEKYLRDVEKSKPRVNVATLVGHGTARSDTGVGAKKKPTEKDIARMAKYVARAMDDGAFGLSTGLEYDPGSNATPEELAGIAKPVGERKGIVMSHLRSEDDDKIEASIDELLAQCEAGGAKAHVAHIKVVLGHGAARGKAILDKLAAARARGLSVTADIYPYTASYTTNGILFPDWARPPNDYKKVKKKREGDLLEYLKNRVTLRNGPAAMLFGTGKYEGITLEAAAKKAGKPFEELLFDMGPNSASAAYFVMDEETMKVLLADPFVMLGTDGGSNSRHPRGVGTFAKAFHGYVTKDGELTLEKMVRKASGLTAETIGLDNRGLLAPGKFADIVVFDPEKFEDKATFAKPRAKAVGMVHVIVGGVVEWKDGAAVKGDGGRALRRK